MINKNINAIVSIIESKSIMLSKVNLFLQIEAPVPVLPPPPDEHVVTV